MEEGRTKKSPPSFSAAWSMNSGTCTAAAPWIPPSTDATHRGDSGISRKSELPVISAKTSDMFLRVGGQWSTWEATASRWSCSGVTPKHSNMLFVTRELAFW